MNAQQLANVKELRSLGARILAEPERYPLWMGVWDCGTHACWLGWYAREKGVVIGRAFSFADPEFGEEHTLELFRSDDTDAPSPAAYTELARRLEFLDSIIAEHEPKVEPKGIPSEVRAIFESTAAEPS